MSFMSQLVKRLVWISIGYLLSAGLGTALAIVENLPAEFGGFLHGKVVLNDFVSGLGTALSPPLIMLVIQILFMILLLRQDSLKKVGAGGLMVVGGLYFVGQVGEPILWRNLAPGGFHIEQALVIAANLVLPALMFYWGLSVLRQLIAQDDTLPH